MDRTKTKQKRDILCVIHIDICGYIDVDIDVEIYKYYKQSVCV